LEWEGIVRRKALVAAFMLADVDDDGDLGRDELVELLKEIRPSVRVPTVGTAQKVPTENCYAHTFLLKYGLLLRWLQCES
jgi:hypothetical protein